MSEEEHRGESETSGLPIGRIQSPFLARNASASVSSAGGPNAGPRRVGRISSPFLDKDASSGRPGPGPGPGRSYSLSPQDKGGNATSAPRTVPPVRHETVPEVVEEEVEREVEEEQAEEATTSSRDSTPPPPPPLEEDLDNGYENEIKSTPPVVTPPRAPEPVDRQELGRLRAGSHALTAVPALPAADHGSLRERKGSRSDEQLSHIQTILSMGLHGEDLAPPDGNRRISAQQAAEAARSEAEEARRLVDEARKRFPGTLQVDKTALPPLPQPVLPDEYEGGAEEKKTEKKTETEKEKEKDTAPPSAMSHSVPSAVRPSPPPKPTHVGSLAGSVVPLSAATAALLRSVPASTPSFLAAAGSPDSLLTAPRTPPKPRGYTLTDRRSAQPLEKLDAAAQDPVASVARRNDMFRDVVQTERTYLHNLNVINQSYLVPLKLATAKPLLKYKDYLPTIFSNTETLQGVHTQILIDLEKVLKHWPNIVTIGATFLRIAPFLKVYSEYVNNFARMLDTLDSLRSDKTFMDWLAVQEESSEAAGYDLSTLLSLPLNRVSQYNQCLNQLLRFTPVDHPDYEELVDAFSIMRRIQQFILERVDEVQAREKVMSVQKQFSGQPQPLAAPNRRFLRDGLVDIQETQKGNKAVAHAGVLFLFNDLLLLGTLKRGVQFGLKRAKEIVYKYYGEIDMAQAVLRDLPDPGGTLFSFQISKRKGSTVYQLGLRSAEEKTQWLTLLNQVANDNQRSRVFGRSLSEVIELNNGQIPAPIVKCMDFIRSHAVRVEGIFRVPPGVTAVEDLKNAFDQGVVTNLEGTDPHVVASVLKLYFRELPEPLIPHSLYDKLVQLSIDHDDAGQRAAALCPVIHTLPSCNFLVLRVVVTFLLYVSEFCEENMMTASNLAIVWGPSIMRPREETIESTMDVPYINRLLQTLIEHFEDIFVD